MLSAPVDQRASTGRLSGGAPRRHGEVLKLRRDGGLADRLRGDVERELGVDVQEERAHETLDLLTRLVADAEVAGLGSFFIGERVRVHVTVDTRQVIVIPRDYVATRFGNDFVTLDTGDGRRDVVVLLGAEGAEGVEILAGLSAGDRLVQP